MQKLEEINLKVDAHEMIETLKSVLEHFFTMKILKNSLITTLDKELACKV